MSNNTIAGFRLSAQQERIWSQRSGESTPYRAQCAVLVEGPLQLEPLKEAVRKVVKRHEILRTVFLRQPGLKVPFQVIRENSEPAWETVDLSGLDESAQRVKIDELFQQAQGSDFNLEQGPMLRVQLAALSQGKHVLVLS